MDDDAWVLRPMFDDRCKTCDEFTTNHDTTPIWRKTCNKCVEPFKDQLKEMDGCEACREQNEDCHKCDISFGDVFYKNVDIMEDLAKPCFDNLNFTHD